MGQPCVLDHNGLQPVDGPQQALHVSLSTTEEILGSTRHTYLPMGKVPPGPMTAAEMMEVRWGMHCTVYGCKSKCFTWQVEQNA